MLQSLAYSVEFPSTGRSFRNTLTFSPGLTAITGRNEQGKSLIIEMIGYALFGKSALRGLAADYKNLAVTLQFQLGVNKVNILRLPKMEQLYIDEEKVAVGAEALNRTIPQLLGFGLDVFNVALVAQQDALNEFTNMKPTARAKMADDLTGMSRLDLTEKDCKTEAKSLSVVADSLVVDIREPIKPTPPLSDWTVAELDVAIEQMSNHQYKRSLLMEVYPPAIPVAPERPDINESEDQLQEHQANRQVILTKKRAMEDELSRIPVPKGSLQDLKRAEAAFEYRDEVRRRGPRPSYDADTLRGWEKLWTQPATGECPNCGFNFTEHTIEVPPLTLSQVRQEINKAQRWAEPLEEVKYIGPVQDIEAERAAHARAMEREKLRHEVEQLSIPVGRSSDLERIRDYNRNWIRYCERRSSYETAKEAYEKARLELEGLEDFSADLAKFREDRTLRLQYDQAMALYEKEMERVSEARIQISGKREEADGFLNGAKALKLTRTKVKQELAPSLSKAASVLLYSLTGGERSTVIVDQDFNVWVDGQPLVTLSGSGKAVVNLALRIGLGQVLTAKVLSLFIGDEIDGSMDQTRAEATHKTFRNLTKHVDQVILITHKDIEADHIISI